MDEIEKMLNEEICPGVTRKMLGQRYLPGIGLLPIDPNKAYLVDLSTKKIQLADKQEVLEKLNQPDPFTTLNEIPELSEHYPETSNPTFQVQINNSIDLNPISFDFLIQDCDIDVESSSNQTESSIVSENRKKFYYRTKVTTISELEHDLPSNEIAIIFAACRVSSVPFFLLFKINSNLYFLFSEIPIELSLYANKGHWHNILLSFYGYCFDGVWIYCRDKIIDFLKNNKTASDLDLFDFFRKNWCDGDSSIMQKIEESHKLFYNKLTQLETQFTKHSYEQLSGFVYYTIEAIRQKLLPPPPPPPYIDQWWKKWKIAVKIVEFEKLKEFRILETLMYTVANANQLGGLSPENQSMLAHYLKTLSPYFGLFKTT